MNKNKVTDTDFSDAEFLYFEMLIDKTLVVHLKNWREMPIKVIFYNLIRFSYQLDGIVQGLYQVDEESSFLNESLSEKYTKIPNNHPYKLFQIEDIDDFPFIQVVAQSVDVIKP